MYVDGVESWYSVLDIKEALKMESKIKQVQLTGLTLDILATNILTTEIPSGVYDIPFDLKGKTILDVGACNGETAYFFKQRYNPEKIVCIEPDEQRLKYLRKNKVLLGNVEIIEDFFKLEHLEIPHDFIKCDIESYEMLLIDYLNNGGVLKPCIVEAHGRWIRDRFLEKGFKVRYEEPYSLARNTNFIMVNW